MRGGRFAAVLGTALLAVLSAASAGATLGDHRFPAGVGSWFAFSLSGAAPASGARGTLVVLEENETHWFLGLADATSLPRMLTSPLVPIGPVEKASLGYHSLDDAFQPWGRGAEVGATWPTRFHGIHVDALVTEVRPGVAAVRFMNPREDAEVATASIDARLPVPLRLSAGANEFRLVASGPAYRGDVVRVEDRVLALTFAAEAGPLRSSGRLTAPAAFVATAATRMAVHGWIEGGTLGAYDLEVRAPDGSTMSLSRDAASPPARKDALWLHERAPGSWLIRRTEGGTDAVGVVGVAYESAVVAARPAEGSGPFSGQGITPGATPAHIMAVGLGAVGALAAWRWRFAALANLVPLFSRLDRGDVLDHPTRALIVELVTNEPGITAAEIRRRLRLTRSPVEYHLGVLRRRAILRRERLSRIILWSRSERTVQHGSLEAVRSLRGTRVVFEAISAAPGVHSAALARRLDLHHSTVQFHVARLIGLGLVCTKTMGRRRSLWVSA